MVRPPGQRRALPFLLAAALAAGLLAVPKPAAAGPPRLPERATQREGSVPGTPARTERANPPSQSDQRRWRPPAPVTWPAPGTAEVDLTGGAPPRRAGDLPVRLAVSAAARAGAAASGEAAPRRLRVTVAERAAAERAGIPGLLLSVRRADGGTGTGRATMTVDYAGFRGAYGGDWASRLRLVRLPACALTEPDRDGCRTQTPVPTSNDVAAGTLTGEVDAGTEATVLAVAAAPAGSSGSYKATSLSPSGTWTAGGNAGTFAWSYDIETPTVPGEFEPDVSLDYSSASVDGRTASSNNQTGWIGEGWEYDPGYIERSYAGCVDDQGGGANNTTKTGDLCWKSDNATVSLNGESTELVRDDATGVWRLAEDDGSRVERLTGTATDTANGDNDNEYWRITKPDGTQYWFGRNRLPGWATGKAETNSAFVAPVFGNHTGEPCHQSTYASSSCNQAWRWQLDYAVDPNGNAMAFYYTKETNAYAKNMATTATASYTRAGYLSRIDYGLRAGQAYAAANPPAQVVFGVAERCLTDCGTFDLAHAANWPDAPADQQCALSAKCLIASPTFWSRKRLTSITTKVLVGTAPVEVDSWALTQEFPGTGDSTSPALWLSAITRTGKAGTAITLPQVDFGGTALDNRVDAAEGRPPLHKYRLTRIGNETGGDILVSYSEPECRYGALPAQDSNTARCFPMWWTPDGYADPVQDWFHRYVVTQVVEDDKVAGSESTVTSYEYVGGMGWRRDDSEFTLAKHRGWNQSRGYGVVRVRQGSGDRSLTETRYYRGMNGDLLASGAARQASVTDSEGNAITDTDALAGKVLEEITYAGDGGPIDTATVTGHWTSAPTATHAVGGLPTRTARLVAEASTTSRELVSGGSGTTWRRTQERTTYNADGLEILDEDLGDLAVTGDETCDRTAYTARDATNWQLSYEATETTTAGTCAVTPAPGNVLTEQRHYYDNQALGVAPQAGKAHETRTETLARYTGTTPVYVATSSTWDAYDRQLSHTNEIGVTTSRTFSPTTGVPTSMTEYDPKGRTTVSALDTRGETRSETDPNGRVSYTDYDALGRLVAVWAAGRAKSLPANVTHTYAVSRTAPSTVTTKTLLDSGAYRTSVALQDGFARERQTQLAANGGGRFVKDTFYDSQGRTVKTNDGYWNSAAPTTTLLNVLDTDVPAQTVTLFDAQDRPTASILLSRGVEQWRSTTTYGNNWTATVPPNGGTPTLEVTDAEDNVVELRQFHPGTSPSFTAPASGYDATRYDYDALDRLVRVVDAAGNTWSYAFDLLGRQVSATDPDSGTTISTYDDAGRLTSTTDARGITLVNTYDEFSRKTSTRTGSATGPKLSEWSYDTLPGGLGLPASTTRYDNGNAYTKSVVGYDAAGRPTGSVVTIPAAEQNLAGSYRFDVTYHQVSGLVATTTYPAAGGLPAETVNHGYTNYGLPTSLDNGQQVYVGGAQYSPYDEVLQTTLGGGSDRVVRTLTYQDATRRLDTVVDERERTGPRTLDNTRYSYDPAGNVTRIRSERNDAGAVDDQCFRYDYLARLTEAWTATDNCAGGPRAGTVGSGAGAAYWQSFTYDLAGNRRTEVRHDPGGNTANDVTRAYGYPAPGQARPHALNQVVGTGPGARTDSFEYDAAGNTRRRVTALGDQTLEWNAEGLLAKSTVGSAVSTFVYDAEGNRLLRRDPAATTLYLDGEELTLNRATGAVSGLRRYEGPECTVTRASDGTVSYLLADHHGTDGLSVNAATLAYSRRDSTPFGGTRGTAPAAWPDARGFVGGTVDASTGLVELGARQYDPNTGRFVSVDPVLDPTDPQQMNGYAYAGNNPVTMTDPDGLRAFSLGSIFKRVKKAIKKAVHTVRKYAKKAVKKVKAKAKPKPKPKPKPKAKPKAKKKSAPGWLGIVGHALSVIGFMYDALSRLTETRTWAYRTMARGATAAERSKAARVAAVFRKAKWMNKLAWIGKNKWVSRAGWPLIAIGAGATYYDERASGSSHKKAAAVTAGSTLGGVGGALLGAKAGAAVGSFGGPVGLVAGTVIGAGVGGFLGSEGGKKVVNAIADWF